MLRSFQEALVGLATRSSWRAQLRSEGESPFDGLTLDARERRALRALSPQALDRYADSLMAKRWQEVLRVIPRTCRVAPSLRDLYREWLAMNPPLAADTLLPPGPAEALRALAPLRVALMSERHAAYAADLLAFEVLGACSRADGAERSLSSRWRLDQVAAEIGRGLLPVDPEERPAHFRFDRTGVRWRYA